jgi:choline dehydrogenase-like flavoprotein
VAPGAELSADVAVVGSGPAGIVTALELATSGFDVVLVESGERRFRTDTQELSDAASWNPDRHAPMSMATRRQVGGASVIWGGRCVPFDPIDFARRDFIPDSAWPVRYEDIAPLFQRACDWFVTGRAVFEGSGLRHLPPSIVPGLPNDDVRTSTFERWSLPTDFGREYGARLKSSTRVRLVTGLTCTRVVVVPGQRRVDHLELRGLGGRRAMVRARHYVLACGGLETTRLLLASPGPDGVSIGDHSGHLGRWYMAHMEGAVARIRFDTPPEATVFGYERDIDGVYIRRRFSFSAEAQKRLALPNIVAWVANPDLPDPSHGSGVLSFAYLALASPVGRVFAPDAQRESLTGQSVPGSPYGPVAAGPLRAHTRNLVRDRRAAARFVVGFGARRFLARRRRVPGFFVYSPKNAYPLQYHGEHLPNRDSRVTLSRKLDAVGMPRLDIDLRFSEDDVSSVVKAHQHWDEYLRRHGCGHVEYIHDDVAAAVTARTGGGFHQAGTTRMSARPEDGVLTPALGVHGFEDLSVASSSAFVTSGQANSTFMVVVFALRLVDGMRRELRGWSDHRVHC